MLSRRAGDLRNPADASVLDDPGFWVITLLSVYILSQSDPLLGRGRPSRLLVAWGAAATAAGMAGSVVSGDAWSGPLAWTV